MRKQNGITLISVIIYVISMLIVISIIATITTYFYRNINVDNDDNQNFIMKYTKLNTVLSVEINKTGNKIIDVKENSEAGNYIIFSTGNQYTFINNKIYKNRMKIIDDVENCKFSYEYIDSSYKITVEITANGLTKTMNYTIK